MSLFSTYMQTMEARRTLPMPPQERAGGTVPDDKRSVFELNKDENEQLYMQKLLKFIEPTIRRFD